MAGQPVCKQCGKPIRGSYLNALGATWHPEHFVCAACHQPIDVSSFNVYEGNPYHPKCYVERVLPRCVYCNAPLQGEYLVDAWGAKFCKRHQQEYPACNFCGRLIPPSQQERGNSDSVRCPICRARAIETSIQAAPIFSQVKQWMSSQGFVYNNLHLTLELVDRNRLAVYMHGRVQPQTGDPHMLGVTRSTTHTLNGREVRTEVDGVAVLQGLPTPLFQGVVVHELGHVWLVVHDIKGLPLWAEEGFCELLAYRYYSGLNTPESSFHAASIENNPSPVYGEGFRRVRAMADHVGFSRLVETLQSTKRLPQYY